MPSELRAIDLQSVAGLLTRSVERVFLVQIGAGDGKTGDPLHEFVQKHEWRGVMVEPFADLYDQLVRNYNGLTGLKFENCAIGRSTGTTNMFRIPLASVHSAQLKDWASGLGSIYKNRNALGGNKISPVDYQRIKPHIVKEKVRTMTLADLYQKHHVRHVDFLKIDTEGFDFHVLDQAFRMEMRPQVIQIQHAALPHAERARVGDLLLENRYTVKPDHKHILASTLL